MTELNEKVTTHKNKDIYLLVPLIPQEGYETFTNTIRSKPDFKRVRFVFNIDNSTIDLNSVYKTGFDISVIKNDISHTHAALSVEYIDNTLLRANERIKIDEKEITYLSPNLKDETIIRNGSNKTEVGCFDYSGFNSPGKRIMGLANINKSTGQLQLDRTFLWDSPEHWSSQDAASVPYAYVSVSTHNQL